MKKSYKHVKYNRQRNDYYQGRRDNKEKENSFYKKILKQIVFCIVIAMLVILIKTIHSPITNKTTAMIKISITKEMDVKKSIREAVRYAKKIPEMPEKAVNVFNTFSERKDSKKEFVVPVNGDIISNYGEKINPVSDKKTFQRGVDLAINEDENIKAIADGEIIEMGEGKLGKTIKIKHKHDVFSFYANCSDLKVKKGQKIKKGEKIANIHKASDKSYTYLHFELWIDGKVVDPTKYIPFGRKIL